MNKTKKSLYLLLISLLIAGLVIVFRSFLMTTIIEPVALLIWLGWRILSSVDQGTYWIILILICTLLVIRLLAFSKDEASISAYNDLYRPPSRLKFWKGLIEDSVLGKNENEQLRSKLKELSINLITRDRQPESVKTDGFITAQKKSLPLVVQQNLFDQSENAANGLTKNWLIRVISLFPRFRKRGKEIMPQDYRMIDEVLTWMETELEINHGK
jgi:hypothetical protein